MIRGHVKALWRRRARAGCCGQVGSRREMLGEEDIPGRGTMEQKGPSRTSVMSDASFLPSPLGQPCSWRRMDNAKIWTLAQKFVSLTVWAGSGKTVESLKFICVIIHFSVSKPPSFPCEFLSAQLNKPPDSYLTFQACKACL